MSVNVFTRSICLVLLLTYGALGSARESIRFTCMQSADTTSFQFLLSLYQEAFNAFDFDFTMSSNPSIRDMTTVNTGVFDGLCLRPEGHVANDLIRVEIPVWIIEFQAWGHSPEVSVGLWTEEELKRYRVGHRRGFKLIGEIFKRRKINISEETTTTASGLKMLATERLDIYIDGKISIEDAMRDQELPRPIYFLGTFTHWNAYPYLHKKHQQLAGPLAAELKRLLNERGGPGK